MGFWPFGGGKKQRSSENDEKQREMNWSKNEKENIQPKSKTTQPTMDILRKSSKNGRDEEMGRFSSNRMSASSVTTHGRRQSRSVTSPATSTPHREDGRRPFDEKNLYQHTPQSQNSFGPENFSVLNKPPTLHAKRSDYDPLLPRRKSSKRKAEDYAREQEVRAISSSPIPIPKRPSSFYGSGPLNKETKEIPGDLNRKLKRPSSNVSLPVAESIQSSDYAKEQHGFKIGTFAALSPRPTVKYDANARKASGKQPDRTKASGVNTIPEEQMSEHLRINELADDLDAEGLRDLMERDRRRRERKRESDKAKLQRKLQRRAERQKEEDARKARTEEYVKNSTPVNEPQTKELNDSPKRKERSKDGFTNATEADPFGDPDAPERNRSTEIRNPFEDEKEGGIKNENTGMDDESEPQLPTRSPLRQLGTEQKELDQNLSSSRSSARPPDAINLSQSSLLNREETIETVDSKVERRASDQSSQRLSTWTSFFKKGKMSSSFRGAGTPSEFSNTSRESFARMKQQVPPIVPPNRTFRRAESGTPQRTMSKFREDLPELPISPPDSRVQSPETSLPPMSATATALIGMNAPSISESGPAESMATTSSPISAQANRVEQKWSMDLDPNPAPEISQSLASVDSEGSWLSGRPIKRFSGPQPIRQSQSSLRRQPIGTYDTETEGLIDDEPNPISQTGVNLKVVDQGLLSNNAYDAEQLQSSQASPPIGPDEEITERYREGIGQQPTLIKQASRAKSNEGLLQEYLVEENKPDQEDDSDIESPGSEEIQEVQVMRAKSVEYKGHARQVSAGSARLLDIKRSSSIMMGSNKDLPATAIEGIDQSDKKQ